MRRKRFLKNRVPHLEPKKFFHFKKAVKEVKELELLKQAKMMPVSLTASNIRMFWAEHSDDERLASELSKVTKREFRKAPKVSLIVALCLSQIPKGLAHILGNRYGPDLPEKDCSAEELAEWLKKHK